MTNPFQKRLWNIDTYIYVCQHPPQTNRQQQQQKKQTAKFNVNLLKVL